VPNTAAATVTYVELLFAGASGRGGEPCFRDATGMVTTFDEFWSRVRRLAGALAHAGFCKGDRLAIVATDSAAYVELLVACLQLGVIYVPLNYRLAVRELEMLLRHCEPRAIAAGDRYLSDCETLATSLAGVPRVIAMDGDRNASSSIEALIAEGRESKQPTLMHDDDIVCVSYTSGTTGRPKGVMLAQRAMKTEIARQREYFPEPGETRYAASPLFHIAGHRMVFTHLAGGCASVILPQFDEKIVYELITSRQLTGLFAVPTMLDRLVSMIESTLSGDAVRGLVPMIMYGGSPMTPQLASRLIDQFGTRLFNLFGSSEAGVISLLRPDDHRIAVSDRPELLGALGKAAPGVLLRLVDNSGRDVEVGQPGEILCRSDGTMSGYLNAPDETAQVLRDGWLWTGDLGRFDADGYLHMAGRTKDVVIRGGENVYPVEVEMVLSGVSGVDDVAVIGLPDKLWGERVVAVVEHSGPQPSIAELTAACESRLARYKVPSEYVFTTSLPRNSAGKVLKGQLRDSQVDGL